MDPWKKKESSLYASVVSVLNDAENCIDVKPVVRVKARSYKENLLKYETVMTAFIFLFIYKETTPLSNYLQTSGYDILKAYNLVKATTKTLDRLRNNFLEVREKADEFVNWITQQFEEKEIDVEIELELPQKRIKRKKSMPGEISSDEAINDALKSFEVNVFNLIIDTVTTSLKTRFNFENNTLYADLAYLDPKAFPNVNSEGLKLSTFTELSKKLLKFDERATVENLRSELIHLAKMWDIIKKSNLEEYRYKAVEEESNSDTSTHDQNSSNTDENISFNVKECKACKNCSICCYRLLNKYNLLTGAYSVIGLAFKYMLTMSFTQVACERSFSTLKFIKNRLRCNLSQQNLESYMLMSIEKEILECLNLDEIIDKVATKSDLLKSLLIV